MYLVFAFVTIPILFFLVTWVAVTAYRIYAPEEPAEPVPDPVLVRRAATAAGQAVTVGVREIREDQLRTQREQAAQAYHFDGGPEGLPPVWVDDLWLRRN